MNLYVIFQQSQRSEPAPNWIIRGYDSSLVRKVAGKCEALYIPQFSLSDLTIDKVWPATQ